MKLQTLVATSLVALLFAPSYSHARDDVAWKRIKKGVKKAWKTPGDAGAKETLVKQLAKTGNADSVELMLDWHLRSGEWTDKELIPAYEEAVEKVLHHERTTGTGAGKTAQKSAVDAWKIYCKRRDQAKFHVDAEHMIRRQLEGSIARLENKNAVAWLANDGAAFLRKKSKNRHAVSMRIASMRCFAHHDLSFVKSAIMDAAGKGGHPKERAMAFRVLAEKNVPEGFEVVRVGLSANNPITVRAAIAALRGYGDPKAVKPLIDALARADAFVGQEIEDVLHWFTGQNFNAVHEVWMRWWDDEGAAWMTSDKNTERHEAKKKERSHTGSRATFYDIPTLSQSIVFVLDRSGSMKADAGEKTKARKKEVKPKGPITGGKKKKAGKQGKEYKPLTGGTRLEVAKSQLQRSVNNLDPDVRFALVFYSSDVKVWQPSPELRPASPAQKQEATKWFEGLKPEGSTQLFEALNKALEYAEVPAEGGKSKKKKKGKASAGGANTIFLLSDGSPTNAGGGVLPSDQVESQLKAFLKANEVFRCVVHTIGIGPAHNPSLLRRIASATGGEYRGVGMD